MKTRTLQIIENTPTVPRIFAVQPIVDDPGGHKLFFLVQDKQSLTYNEVDRLRLYLTEWMAEVSSGT